RPNPLRHRDLCRLDRREPADHPRLDRPSREGRLMAAKRLAKQPDDWRGMYVQRGDDGAIVAAYGNLQPGLELEPVADAGPDLVAYPAPMRGRGDGRRRVRNSVITCRLTDEHLAPALYLVTPRQMERWRAPDQPTVYADDAETVAIVT